MDKPRPWVSIRFMADLLVPEIRHMHQDSKRHWAFNFAFVFGVFRRLVHQELGVGVADRHPGRAGRGSGCCSLLAHSLASPANPSHWLIQSHTPSFDLPFSSVLVPSQTWWPLPGSRKVVLLAACARP